MRKLGTCFQTAEELSDAKIGRNVSGFTSTPDGVLAFPHAWLTLNGVDAIDAVWPHCPECEYFGSEGRKHSNRLLRMFMPVKALFDKQPPRQNDQCEDLPLDNTALYPGHEPHRLPLLAAFLLTIASVASAQDTATSALRDAARAQEMQARSAERLERIEHYRARDEDRAQRNAERDSRSARRFDR